MLVAVGEKVTERYPQTLSSSVFDVQGTTVFGERITNIQIIVFVVAVGLTFALAWFVRASRHGRAMRALAFDPEATRLLGVPPDRLASITMFASGAIAGGAGVLLAISLNTVSATMGEGLLLKAFTVIVIAGVGSIGGAAFAAFLLACVEVAMVQYFSSDLKDAVAFVLIILILLVRPQGLFAKQGWQRA
jgi:branched-chain amino acid transport system permease protein